jgi:hypothetical protein
MSLNSNIMVSGDLSSLLSLLLLSCALAMMGVASVPMTTGVAAVDSSVVYYCVFVSSVCVAVIVLGVSILSSVVSNSSTLLRHIFSVSPFPSV